MKFPLDSKALIFVSMLILTQACKVVHEMNISGNYSYQGKPVLNLKPDSTFSFDFDAHMISGSTYGRWTIIDKNYLEASSSIYDSIFIYEEFDKDIRDKVKFSGIDIHGNDLPDHYISINDSVELHLQGTSFIEVEEVNRLSFVVRGGGFDSSGIYHYKVKNPEANVFTIKRPIKSNEYNTYWYKVKFRYKSKQLITFDNIFHPGYKIYGSTKLKKIREEH